MDIHGSRQKAAQIHLPKHLVPWASLLSNGRQGRRDAKLELPCQNKRILHNKEGHSHDSTAQANVNGKSSSEGHMDEEGFTPSRVQGQKKEFILLCMPFPFWAFLAIRIVSVNPRKMFRNEVNEERICFPSSPTPANLHTITLELYPSLGCKVCIHLLNTVFSLLWLAFFSNSYPELCIYYLNKFCNHARNVAKRKLRREGEEGKPKHRNSWWFLKALLVLLRNW